MIRRKAAVQAIPFPEGGRLLAVSDVHGELTWLKALLEKAAFSRRDALVLVGDFLAGSGYQRSKLYDPTFTTGYREGRA